VSPSLSVRAEIDKARRTQLPLLRALSRAPTFFMLVSGIPDAILPNREIDWALGIEAEKECEGQNERN
jgi:hypothetical protein